MTFGPPKSPEIDDLEFVFKEGYRFTVTRLALSLFNPFSEAEVDHALSQFQRNSRPDELLIFHCMSYGGEINSNHAIYDVCRM
jgi:hypothetical protein